MMRKYKRFLESKKKFPNIKIVKYNGFEINIGRDAKSNDHLTFNLSSENDIWLHSKGFPGSHVAIRVLNDKLPTEDVIKYAAELAKKNSKAKGHDNVEVVYCKRKFVTKESGMNHGQVKVDYLNVDYIKI